MVMFLTFALIIFVKLSATGAALKLALIVADTHEMRMLYNQSVTLPSMSFGKRCKKNTQVRK
jgi:hypothetical protein